MKTKQNNNKIISSFRKFNLVINIKTKKYNKTNDMGKDPKKFKSSGNLDKEIV